MRNGKTTEILSSLLWDSHKILWGIFVRGGLFVLSFQILILAYNEIFEIHQMAFNGLRTLDKLDISHNRLNKAPFISSVKNTLLRLDLSWNGISHISDTHFHSCKKIRNIFLNNNHLIAIPNFRYVSKSITFLNLATNNITNVIPIYGIRFPRLQTLILEANQIRSFCFPPVYFVPRIKQVGLQLNNLQRICFSHASSPRRREVMIYLGHNPWHCNGSLDWTQQCTKDADLNMTCMEWLIVQGMICASPPEAQGLTPKEAGGILYI